MAIRFFSMDIGSPGYRKGLVGLDGSSGCVVACAGMGCNLEPRQTNCWDSDPAQRLSGRPSLFLMFHYLSEFVQAGLFVPTDSYPRTYNARQTTSAATRSTNQVPVMIARSEFSRGGMYESRCG